MMVKIIMFKKKNATNYHRNCNSNNEYDGVKIMVIITMIIPETNKRA